MAKSNKKPIKKQPKPVTKDLNGGLIGLLILVGILIYSLSLYF